MTIDAEKFENQARHQSFIHRALGAFDVLLNVWTGGATDDTISSRMQRWKDGTVPHPNAVKRTVGRFMCWWLGKIQKDHDIKANAGDLARAEDEEKRTRQTLQDSGAEDIK